MKVGKAIYNILSRAIPVQQNIGFSTDTFAPSGEELVTNGDFSATGSELVTNGNFDSTGSELVTNGSFENNGDNWTIEEGSGTVTFPNNLAKIISTGAAAQTGITQNILTNNKSYKVTIDVASITGTLKLLMGGNGNVTLITAPGIQTFYLQTATITNATFYLIRNIGDTVDVVLNSVSVKELGEGWQLVNASIDANGARIDNGATTDNAFIKQTIAGSPLGKSFVLTYDVIATNGALLAIEQLTSISLDTATTGTNRKFYFTWTRTSSTSLVIKRQPGQSVDITIDNVRLQELGEGWTDIGAIVGSSVASFNANGLTITTVNGNGNDNRVKQANVTEDAKSYKVTYTIHARTLTGGNVLQYFNGITYVVMPTAIIGTAQTFYFTRLNTDDHWYFRIGTFNGSTTDFVTIGSVSVQEMVLTKIFPEIAPPDIDPPYIVYSVVSNQPSNTKNENGEIDEASLEVYSFQDTYNKTVDLGVAVRASLDRVNGTFATVKVDSINYTNEQMDVNESRKLWAAIQDYTVRIKNI